MADALTDLTPVFRALNAVKTAGAARGAALAASEYVGRIADRASELSMFFNGIDGEAAQSKLNAMADGIDKSTSSLPATAGFVLSPSTWAPISDRIRAAVIEAAGVEGALSGKPTSGDLAGIILDAVKDAPAVAAGAAGKALGTVTATVGNAAGGLLGGLLGGLGWWAIPVALVLGYLVWRKATS